MKGSSETNKRRHNLQSPGNEQQKAEISEFLDDLRELGIGDPKSPTPDLPSSPAAPAAAPDASCPGLTQVQQKLVQEWVPLELSFGVPLFGEQANRAVCDKVHPPLTFSLSLLWQSLL